MTRLFHKKSAKHCLTDDKLLVYKPQTTVNDSKSLAIVFFRKTILTVVSYSLRILI